MTRGGKKNNAFHRVFLKTATRMYTLAPSAVD